MQNRPTKFASFIDAYCTYRCPRIVSHWKSWTVIAKFSLLACTMLGKNIFYLFLKNVLKCNKKKSLPKNVCSYFLSLCGFLGVKMAYIFWNQIENCVSGPWNVFHDWNVSVFDPWNFFPDPCLSTVPDFLLAHVNAIETSVLLSFVTFHQTVAYRYDGATQLQNKLYQVVANTLGLADCLSDWLIDWLTKWLSWVMYHMLFWLTDLGGQNRCKGSRPVTVTKHS